MCFFFLIILILRIFYSLQGKGEKVNDKDSWEISNNCCCFLEWLAGFKIKIKPKVDVKSTEEVSSSVDLRQNLQKRKIGSSQKVCSQLNHMVLKKSGVTNISGLSLHKQNTWSCEELAANYMYMNPQMYLRGVSKSRLLRIPYFLWISKQVSFNLFNNYFMRAPLPSFKNLSLFPPLLTPPPKKKSSTYALVCVYAFILPLFKQTEK